jgi:hypothetical protein
MSLRPTIHRVTTRLVALALAFAGVAAVYAGVARPWMLRWGASDAEVTKALPGDEIVPRAREQETRAIAIEAPAWAVWPWVAQIGQDRAGFYSYRLLENAVGCEMPNVQAIVRRFQSWAPGDKLWMYPARKAGGAGFATLVVYQPGRALGFATRQIGMKPTEPADASWSFVVEPMGDRASRLIFRGRGEGGLRLLPAAFTRGVFEPMHFAMERRTMTAVKELAEGGRPSESLDSAQVVVWALVFFGFVTTGFVVVMARRPAVPLAVFALLGLLFQLLTLAQPHPALGAALFVALAAGPYTLQRWSARRRRHAPA